MGATKRDVMFLIWQIVTVVLVAVGMALSLAHALELPGKLRLGKESYLAVQPIYYPGFTIGGAVGEFGGMIATLTLLIATPHGTTAFWLTLIALVCLVAAHLAYWLLTHPVNNFWLRGERLEAAGVRFFSSDPFGRGGRAADWTELRDCWECSHVVRAVLAGVGFIFLVAAVAL